MQNTNSSATTPSRRRRIARFAGVALAATTVLGAFGTAAHADGDVDAADFQVWQDQYGRTTEADFNHDGVVDGADFLVWQRHTAAADDSPHQNWIIIQSMSSPIYR